MPTPAEQRVLRVLDEKSGSVEAAAKALSLSHSFVNRIKKTHWKQPDPTVTAVSAVNGQQTAIDILREILPPNIDGVTQLRDSTIAKLQTIVENNITTRDAIKLLEVLTSYEGTLRRSMLPSVNLYQDNRNQTLNVDVLVDKLADMSPDTLRQLSGQPAPLVIEGEI